MFLLFSLSSELSDRQRDFETVFFLSLIQTEICFYYETALTRESSLILRFGAKRGRGSRQQEVIADHSSEKNRNLLKKSGFEPKKFALVGCNIRLLFGVWIRVWNPNSYTRIDCVQWRKEEASAAFDLTRATTHRTTFIFGLVAVVWFDWAADTMPPSRLDGLYRSLLLTKFFCKGWGKPENLERWVTTFCAIRLVA